MRLLLLSQSYPPRLGGLETVAETLAIGLAARGHQVRVVSNRHPRRLPAWELRNGIEVERILFLTPRIDLFRRRRPDLWLASLFFGPAAGLRLGRIMRRWRPDVVNVHFPDVMVPFVRKLRHRYPFRLVVSLHGHEVERFTAGACGETRRAATELRALLREADAVTACSRHLLSEACRLEPSVASKGTAVYNGIDPARFEDGTPYRHPRPYILALGRLVRKKGFDLLLDALVRAGPDASDVDLIVAGEGEERDALEAQARSLDLAGRVHFAGKACPAEVVRLLRGCRFLAVPSRAEPFGIVALEGLAAAKPLLATKVGGMGELLSEFVSSTPSASPNGTGSAPVVLVEPTVEALAQGLRTCLAVDCSAAGHQAIAARIVQQYSWDTIIERYEAVLAGQKTCPTGVYD